MPLNGLVGAGWLETLKATAESCGGGELKVYLTPCLCERATRASGPLDSRWSTPLEVGPNRDVYGPDVF
ncbi:hypothetical protein Ddye_013823 [Dipteronia dyeriana]|uniref:Uncharacterized protein n=1 Tax=Dipteronia dyeriana TaxID=168575 RepID=A0AAE0CJY0_9ROSI|nr:hypothetical protein Ddye_013823 [Dipteronia dyeriana]